MSTMTPAQLELWLIERLATRLKLPKAEIDPERPVEEFGIDSLEAVALTTEIEVLLHRTVEPTVVWDYGSLRALATFLSDPPRGQD